MKTTVWIARDQLTPGNSALADLPPQETTILMIESLARARERQCVASQTVTCAKFVQYGISARPETLVDRTKYD